MVRILYAGENWYGSCARACCFALRRLGCDVTDVDVQTYFPQGRSLLTRAASRALLPGLRRDYNEALLRAARVARPHFLLAFKGAEIHADTLRRLRADGVRLYNYYPDTSAFAHGSLLEGALPEYDCVFATKRFWIDDVRRRVALRATRFLPHGYDPELHRPPADGPDPRFGDDVCVIATHTQAKEEVLAGLAAALPGVGLAVWGNGWKERCRSAALRPFVRGEALVGSSYPRAIASAAINLALMSGRVEGASQGDETTTRTYEIPACGGFMLHERTPELAELFEEGREVACFGSVDELAAKIEHYLAHPAERRAIAAAGRARCVPAYAYDERMREILAWHDAATSASPARAGEAEPAAV
jgi:spore maturation protein CgeB